MMYRMYLIHKLYVPPEPTLLLAWLDSIVVRCKLYLQVKCVLLPYNYNCVCEVLEWLVLYDTTDCMYS